MSVSFDASVGGIVFPGGMDVGGNVVGFAFGDTVFVGGMSTGGRLVGVPFGDTVGVEISLGERVPVGRRSTGGSVTGWSFWEVGGAVEVGEIGIGCKITGIPPALVGLNVIGAAVGSAGFMEDGKGLVSVARLGVSDGIDVGNDEPEGILEGNEEPEGPIEGKLENFPIVGDTVGR